MSYFLLFSVLSKNIQPDFPDRNTLLHKFLFTCNRRNHQKRRTLISQFAACILTFIDSA